jgi:serine/threonine protein kinase
VPNPDPDRWKRIEEIFQRAVELDPEEREAHIARQSEGDPDLLATLTTLIESHLREGGPLETTALSRLSATSDLEEPGDLTGENIGRYSIRREIARGGLGTVYAAIDRDGVPGREVALKVIRRGMDTDLIIRQFQRERRILSELEHPNICRLLDAGATGSGRPYLVMERIDGEQIDRYCDRRRLSVSDRLGIFLKVCEAVQYAHARLVVHRDLKPANILVTREGEPKLLDFGTAKVLDATRSGLESTLTPLGMRWFTPRYASPEVLTGRPASTLADVFSLGLILYELLTGRPARRLAHTLTLEEVERLCEHDPPLPSVAVSQERAREDGRGGDGIHFTATLRGLRPVQLKKRLQGDLDKIVMMAIRRKEGERYRSVHDLSGDLRRHLAHLPVAARAETLPSRTVKFFRRNRLAVLATAVVVILASGSGLALWRQSRAATAQRVVAEQERAKSEAVLGFLLEMVELTDPEGQAAGNMPIREVVESASRRIHLGLEEHPEVRSALLRTMGGLYRRMGLYEQAAEDQRKAYEISELVNGPDHPDTISSEMEMARVRIEVGEYTLAERQLHSVLERTVRDHGGFDNEVSGEVLVLLSHSAMVTGQLERALELGRSALGIRRTVFGPDHPAVAEVLHELGAIQIRLGSFADAERLILESLDIRRTALGPSHPDVATSQYDLAMVQLTLGDLDQARDLVQSSLEIYLAAYGDGHHATIVARMMLVEIKRREGEYAEAERLARKNLEGMRALFPRSHPRVATALHELGYSLYQKGVYAEAEPFLAEAVSMREQSLGPGNVHIATSLHYLAEIARMRGELGRSLAMHSRALAIRREALLPTHWRVARSLVAVGRVRLESGDLAGARAMLEEARKALAHPETAAQIQARSDRELLDDLLARLGGASTPGAP